MSRYALGDANARINVYIEKAPPFEEVMGFAPTSDMTYPLHTGDIQKFGAIGGNGWRKVFNVYAKWLFSLNAHMRCIENPETSWQSFRDNSLLRENSSTRLLFGQWAFPPNEPDTGIHVIAGRIHATKMGIAAQCIWIDHEFARHPTRPIVICPFFDYRQLSNAKIEVLSRMVSANTSFL